MPEGDTPTGRQALLEAMPGPIVLVDAQGLVVATNRRATAMFSRLEPRAPLAFGIRDPEVLDAVQGALEGGEVRRVQVIERVPVERSFDVVISPLDWGAGRQVVVSFQDTTALRRAELMRVDFVANASHELRTPLASLLGFIETLQSTARNDPEARQRFLAIMADQARRMSRLIDDLLSLSRIELSAHLRPDKPVRLVSVIRQIIDALTALARERGVDVVLTHVHLPEAVIDGDADELLRVFENLIDNAIKYGHTGGRVEVAVEKGPGEREVTVLVRDFGPGIAVEHLPRLTERFYRVNVASSREQGGTGLGLAIVKHIVARHRGRLEVTSQLGQGSTFSVTFERRMDGVAGEVPAGRERQPLDRQPVSLAGTLGSSQN